MGRRNDGDSMQLTSLAGARDLMRQQSSGMDLENLASASRGDASTPDFSSLKNESAPSSISEKSRAGSELEKSSTGTRPAGTSREAAQGAIIRKTNPYADVPSLYDMYVQVSAQGRAAERFGVSILSAGMRESAAMPMDLPVGPDYVVGPGDGLAIDLWGGVSQRMVRVVDRQGRISLPEAGPMLVSGKTLGDVQMTVQQALRMEYRDVSADVSLSG